MYYFQFKKSKTLNHDPGKKYNVHEAIKYMNDVHKDRQIIEKPMKLFYKIIDDKTDEPYLSDAILLGQQSRFDFFMQTSSRFRHIFANDEEILIQLNQFLDELEKQYERELIERYEVTDFIDNEPKDLVDDNKSDSISKTTDDELLELESDEIDNKTEEESKAKKRKKRSATNVSKKFNKKTWKVATVVLVTTLVVFLGRQVVSSGESFFEPDYDNLMAEERYVEALEYYPENIDEIEREIFLQGQDGIEDLEELVNDYPEYLPGQFDLAYLKQDYPKVIELKNNADSIARKAQLAVAYLNENQLEEAETLNKEVNSQEIKELIQASYTEKGRTAIKNNDMNSAKSYQEKSQNNDLKEIIDSLEKINLEVNELEKDNKEKNQEKIKKLKEDSERIKADL